MAADGTNPTTPQLVKTGPFTCDRCKERISNTAAAWGEWYGCDSTTREDTERNWNFTIVHGPAHSRHCTLPESSGRSVCTWSLDFLLSADGFSFLLEFFVSRDVDPVEFSRFLMRLYVPGYDAAYQYIDMAIADEVHEPRCHPSFLTQDEIRRILEAKAAGRFETYM